MLAVCGVVRRLGRILVCKRPAGGVFPGFWELPTEPLELEDSFEDALERGFFDRLSVRLKGACPLGGVDFEDVRLLGYDVELQKNFIHIYGYDDFRWIKPRNLKRIKLLRPFELFLKSVL